jgi:hypothetical protein
MYVQSAVTVGRVIMMPGQRVFRMQGIAVTVVSVPLNGDNKDIGYQDILQTLKKHIYFEDERYYDLILLWIMGTYMYHSFERYPYLYVVGAKGAGKSTRLGKAILRLSNNGMKASNSTLSPIFRAIEDGDITLILDEQNRMSGEMKDLLKDGNDADGSVLRTINGHATQFSSYCPKAIIQSNNKGFDPYLLDRSFPIIMQKNRRSGTCPIPRSNWIKGNEAIEAWIEKNKKDVETVYDTLLTQKDSLRGQEEAYPILSIGKILMKNDKTWLDGIRYSGLRDLLESIDKEKEDLDDSPEVTLMKALLVLVDHKGYYDLPKVLSAMLEIDEEGSMSLKSLGRLMHTTLHIESKNNGKRKVYHLSPESVKRKADEMGISIEAETTETSWEGINN